MTRAAKPKFKLNFLLLLVKDLDSSLDFYTRKMRFELIHRGASGATLSNGWMRSLKAAQRGFTVEVFPEVSRLADGRSWGRGQAVRPGIVIPDLDATVTELRQRGIRFTGDVVERPWGRQIEFVAAEDVRWTLVEAPDSALADRDRLNVGWVELKVSDLEAQKHFYRDVFGLRIEEKDDEPVVLRQEEGEPFVVLVPGGETTAADSPLRIADLYSGPLMLSVETSDVEKAAAWAKSHGAAVLQDVVHHETWDGSDMKIADPDGNTVQIVEYRSEGSWTLSSSS